MTKNGEYRPRLSVDLEDKQTKRKLDELIPHGMLKPTINALVEDLVEMLKERPKFVLGAIMAREIELEDIMSLSEEPFQDDPPPGARYKKPYIVKVVKQCFEKNNTYGSKAKPEDYHQALVDWFEEGDMPLDGERG